MVLDDKYRIIYEENNVILQFYQDRVRVKKSGLKEPFEFTDNFYYPTLKDALKAYLNRTLIGSKKVEVVLERINLVENLINKLIK